MKRKGLFLLIGLALGGVGAVHAQDTAGDTASSTSSSYDGRWYIAPTVGGYYNDTDRNTNSRQVYYGLGFGKFISNNASIDIFADRTKRDNDGVGHWSNNSYGVAARFYAGAWDAWRPYLLAGVMGSYHHNPSDNGWSPAAELGVGVSKTITDSSDVRVEAGYRYDWDDKTVSKNNGYGDWFLGFSIVSRFGAPPAAPAAPVAVAPAAPDCSTLDSDGDGVNDCDDKCPNTPAGTIVGPDGCPQKVVIDLRGVNFKFDRPKKGEKNIGPSLQEPTSESLGVLDQAVDTLQRYPQVKVMVAGYTDSVGKDAYNQGLSERRSKIVYDYLTAHGIGADRLEGPVGHGKNNPIDTNDTAEGRARNRRTELQVQQ
ncbi:OOP family OmpA-OmpF porin [Luteibacter rhizovicinus]|uniref:OOP family OmpA-OmpF porin n=1 Tax=Luteibacter rhizovicinus TaxID=242606 RepID=A0A4R3YK83_9GAMM|nr:OmpA family protein [Luteibacter rhizovicinus]TCV91434.1 OOP family OmpA-OmpF porin [Luteibacter rhizovicinus]